MGLAATPEEPRVLSIPEVARHLGVSEWLIRREIFKGRLVGRKVGARVVVCQEDFASYLGSLPRAKGKVGR